MSANGRRGMDILERRIAPGAFHDSGRKYELPKCHMRTRTAILAMLAAWVEDAGHRGCGILWLYGPPGSGKSSIAQTIAQVSFERGLLAASFFFDRNTPGLNTEKHLMATLAHQISNTVPEAGRFIAEAVEKDPGVFSGSLESQLQALIVGPLVAAHAAHNAALIQHQTTSSETTATNTGTSPIAASKPSPPAQPPKKWARLLVIDALDSCHGAAVQRYIVRILSTALIHKRVPLFILVSSRPLPPIRDSFNSYDLRELILTLPLDSREGYLTDSEVKRYFWSRFEYIRMTHPLRGYIPASWPTSQMIASLVARTAGQFVYASTVVKYVDSAQHRPVERLDAVLRIQAGSAPQGQATAGLSGASGAEVPFAELDALYRHVLGGVGNSKAVLRILGAILFAQRLYSSRSSSSSSNSGDGEVPIPVTDPRFLEEILGLNRGDVPFMLQDLHSIVYVPDAHARRQGVVQVGNVVQMHNVGGSGSGTGSGAQRDPPLVPAHGGGVGTPASLTSPTAVLHNAVHHHQSHGSSGGGMHTVHSTGIQPGTQVVAYGSSAAHPPVSVSAAAQPVPPYSAHTQAYGTSPSVYAPPAHSGHGHGHGHGQIQAYGQGLGGGSGGAGGGSGSGSAVGGGSTAGGSAGAMGRGGTQPVLVAYSRGGQQFTAARGLAAGSSLPHDAPPSSSASGVRKQSQSQSPSLRHAQVPAGRASGSRDRDRGRDGGEGRSGSGGHSVSGGSVVGSPVRRSTFPQGHSNGHGHGGHRAHPYDSSGRHARSPPTASSSSHPHPHQHQHPQHPPSRRSTASQLPSSATKASYNSTAQTQTGGVSGTVSSAPATSTGIRILHSSLIDFLTDRSRAGRYFINSVKVHAELARSCVRNLLSGHKYVHQYAGQALVTHCRYSVLTHELHTDLLHFDLGIWIATCKTWSDGGYGESVYANSAGDGGASENGGEHKLRKSNGHAAEDKERDNSAAGGGNGDREKEDVPRQAGYAVGPFDQAWIELPGLFHWFKTLTYTDSSKDLHTIHMGGWEQYLLNDLPRYAAHPALEALLVFASIPSGPVSITASKSKAAAASAASPTSPSVTSPTSPTSPTTTTTSSSTNAWAWDWLHVWPLLGIQPAEAASLEDEDRSMLHFTGLRPGSQFDGYRGMVQEFLSDRVRAGHFSVVCGKAGERGHGAATVARVAESVCRYLMEPKKAGKLYPYRLPAEWTWFREGHDDKIFRENRTKETFQAGLVYLPFLLQQAAKRESLIEYLKMGDGSGSGSTTEEVKIRSIDIVRAKELPRLAWAEDKARAEEAIRAYLDRCEAKEEEEEEQELDSNERQLEIEKQPDAMEVDAPEDSMPTPKSEHGTDLPATSEVVPPTPTEMVAETMAADEPTAELDTQGTPTPRAPSTSREGTAASTTPTTTPSADAHADASENIDANTSGDVDMDAEGEVDADADSDADADADADAEADTDPEAEDIIPESLEETQSVLIGETRKHASPDRMDMDV